MSQHDAVNLMAVILGMPDGLTGHDVDGPQSAWLSELDRATRFHQWVMDTIGPLPGPRVLEVGCGIGTYTARLASVGYEVTACDINPLYVEHATGRFAGKPHVEIRLEDATELPHDGELWDSAILLDVLEHLADDVGVLQDLGRRLRLGGVLAIKVPAHEWLRGSLDDAVGHYRRYSKTTLTATAEKAGFEVMSMRSFNLLALPGWFINARLARRDVAPAYQIRTFERLVPLARILDRINPFGIGTSLVATLRKV